MHASLSALYFGLLLPVSVMSGPVGLPSESDVHVAELKPITTGETVQTLDERSLQSSQNDKAVPQLHVRDDDDDDDDSLIDDIKDKADDVGDDVKDNFDDAKDNAEDNFNDAKDDVKDKVDGAKDDVDDAFDDGVGSLKPGLVTVGILAVAAAAGVM